MTFGIAKSAVTIHPPGKKHFYFICEERKKSDFLYF